MTRTSTPPTLLQLQSADSLKNEIIGHDQRKEIYVKRGIIPVLTKVLTSRKLSGKSVTATVKESSGIKSEEDDACLQAIIILGSLTQGGPAFLAPILASNTLPTLLSFLSSPSCPSFFRLPILRTLNSIADRLPFAESAETEQGYSGSFCLAQKKHVQEPGALGFLPPPAPPSAKLASNPSCAEHFLSSPGIVTVFPKQLPEFAPSDIKKGPWGSTYFSGSASAAIGSIISLDGTGECSQFPTFRSPRARRRPSHSFPTSFSLFESTSSDDDENCIPRLVTSFFRLGLAKKHRVSLLSYLLIPILIRMLDKDYEIPGDDIVEYGGLIPATALLAALVIDDQELQKHATYNPIHENTKPNSTRMLDLDHPGFSPTHCHVMRYRENYFEGTCSSCSFQDEYRKLVCENGVVPYIIDSLKPCPSELPVDPNSSDRCWCAAPLFVLIRHPDIEVQIAATSVICNLALGFSPMKEVTDILPVLCEHAHHQRLLDGLGPGWIKQIITQDPTSALAKRGIGRRPNSAGEQVNLLNPVEDSQSRGEDLKMTDTLPASKMSLEMRRKLVLRQDDIAVQEQTFDLLRNLVCGSGASEMIDHLFKEIGQDLILDALADKLRPPHHQSPTPRALNVPTEILVSVTFVIIHLAASLPWHRQVLVSHPTLLQHLMWYFNHSHRDVRINCVWVNDASDHDGCRERAFKLRSLGVIERLTSLLDDPDLDVRERTKTEQSI
ncbi:ARM repeat-containing protein [Aspergillus novofumigatus IBT 16806]|uniref:ARM repeat-containing protein n=1 Tax=Aspergillus novofumigatus (strain IBT 16806) TaxID=1392255 RepID=A0A2I1BSF1_ASPN1|nr:ARM repeat-containing protein [Aspergillus novofumigatus IBT 16806]PKX88221.1 ARM repeat-containing protein [Aspergillus novofumigatus IBT 16806]